MKNIYWRPNRVPRIALALIAVFAVVGLYAVETFQIKARQEFYREKLKASRLADEAFRAIKEERLRRGLVIDPESDLSQSGLLGEVMSPVTSNSGSLSAKQTSINPNFAAVAVHYLMRAGVEEGDVVAAGLSGSFPAINVCVMAAFETLKLRPIVITSASASSWGANNSGFVWLEMEKLLYDKRLISFRSVAASIGGVEDRGIGMSKRGIRSLNRTIRKSGLPFIDPVDYAESVELRMAIYREQAGLDPIKAYVNVGGGTTSVGTKLGKRMFKPGLNRRSPIGGPPVDSVMGRMVDTGTPVIHFVKIERMAKRYGLPQQPQRIPPVGEGKIFLREQYNPVLAGGVLAALLVILFVFVRSDWGFRILVSSRKRKGKSHPEPMV